jgi:hypothetical protein
VDSPSELRTHSGRKRHWWWLWFGGGFAIVFIVMSLTLSVYVPQGHGIVKCKLWRYYVLAIPQVVQSAPLGPNNLNTGNLLTHATTHVVCSALGGLALLGAGWCVGKVKAFK